MPRMHFLEVRTRNFLEHEWKVGRIPVSIMIDFVLLNLDVVINSGHVIVVITRGVDVMKEGLDHATSRK